MKLRLAQTYLTTLTEEFGAGWNRFWFQPRRAELLSILRIAVGVTALYVVATYGWDLVDFFGPGGYQSPALVENWMGPETGGLLPGGLGSSLGRFSLLYLCTSPAALWGAWGASLIVLLCYTLGLCTRVMAVLSWLVVISFAHRGPLLTQLVEPLLAMSLAYLAIGPCGACWSLDGWRRRRGGGAAPVATVSATISQRLLQVHVTVIYVMMGLAKLAAGDVWFTGDAVWRLAAKPESRLLDLTQWLQGSPLVVQAWSHAIVLFELLFAVFIWNRLARPLLLTAACLMWTGLAVLTGDLPFCLLMLALSFVFVTPAGVQVLCGESADSPAVAGG